jgi:hypothetical protein
MPPSDLQTLWQSPDQAGTLRKFTQSRVTGFVERFVVLKGSTLFIFKSRYDVKRLNSVVPLEGARIAEGPPNPGFAAVAANEAHLCITITLNIAHAYTAKHEIAVLMAPSTDVHTAWVAALRQASIPRETLLDRLSRVEGFQTQVMNEQSQRLALAFPTQDSAVVSCPGHIRMLPAGALPAAAATGAKTTLPINKQPKNKRTSATEVTAYVVSEQDSELTEGVVGSGLPGSLRASFSHALTATSQAAVADGRVVGGVPRGSLSTPAGSPAPSYSTALVQDDGSKQIAKDVVGTPGSARSSLAVASARSTPMVEAVGA